MCLLAYWALWRIWEKKYLSTLCSKEEKWGGEEGRGKLK